VISSPAAAISSRGRIPFQSSEILSSVVFAFVGGAAEACRRCKSRFRGAGRGTALVTALHALASCLINLVGPGQLQMGQGCEGAAEAGFVLLGALNLLTVANATSWAPALSAWCVQWQAWSGPTCSKKRRWRRRHR
jgi:hypothetical protein